LKTKRIEKYIVEISKSISGILGLSIFIITLLQIFCRIFLRISLPWVFELVSICAVYLAFIGASVVLLTNKTARFCLFIERLPLYTQRVISIFIRFVTIFMGGAIIYSAVVYKKLLDLYQMSNLPLSAGLFSYPIIFLGICIFWKGLEK